VATLVKILVDKGYIGVEAMGRVHRYFPLVSKESYSTNSIKSLVDAYFEGSFSEAVSCMLQQKEISVQELELLLNQLKQSKK
jgi:predicted transcriptional regulator